MNIGEVIKTGNLIYKITKDIEVNESIDFISKNIPNCTFDFQGGKLIGNATITFNKAKILPDGCLLSDYVKCNVSDNSTYAIGQKFVCTEEEKELAPEDRSSREFKMWIGKDSVGNVNGWFYFADADKYVNKNFIRTINGDSLIGEGDIKISDKPFNLNIVNDLTTGGTESVLSAEQGKILNEKKVESHNLKSIYNVDDDFLRLSLRKNEQILTSDDIAQVYQNLELNQHFVRIGDDYKPIEINGNSADALKEGTTDQRPKNVKDGFQFFDESPEINKFIWKRAKSSTGWVDANGQEI